MKEHILYFFGKLLLFEEKKSPILLKERNHKTGKTLSIVI